MILKTIFACLLLTSTTFGTPVQELALVGLKRVALMVHTDLYPGLEGKAQWSTEELNDYVAKKLNAFGVEAVQIKSVADIEKEGRRAGGPSPVLTLDFRLLGTPDSTYGTADLQLQDIVTAPRGKGKWPVTTYQTPSFPIPPGPFPSPGRAKVAVPAAESGDATIGFSLAQARLA